MLSDSDGNQEQLESSEADSREEDSEEPEESDEEEEEEDDSSDCESDDDSSFDELSVGVALELPKRENRGKKYTKLVGEELEKDQQFWGHNTWEEEAVDEDYNCSEGEEQYAYSTDSDFDDPESQESEGEVDESHLKERRRKKHGAYVDPALQRNRRTRMAYEKHKVKQTQGEKKKPVKRSSITTVEAPVDRSMRATTKKKTEAIIELERRRDIQRTAIASAASKKKTTTNVKTYTQEELMAMALKTEVENKRSLANLQAWEDEKKRYDDVKKWQSKGYYDIWVCWNSLLSIVTNDNNEQGEEAETLETTTPIEERPLELYMFTTGKLPEYYEAVAEEKERLANQPKPLCAITGKPAKYRDPLTGQYYSCPASYRVLRMHVCNTENTEIAASLNHMEDTIQELLQTE